MSYNLEGIRSMHKGVECYENNKYIDRHVIRFLKDERFYKCRRYNFFDEFTKDTTCYRIIKNFEVITVFIYIVNEGIGVQVNFPENPSLSSKEFFYYKDYDNFAGTYNDVIKYIEKYK